MKFLPDAKVQSLAECEPGQLVRSIDRYESDRFGLVFQMVENGNEMRGIVSLAESGPTYLVDQRPVEKKVLAYSGEVTFDVNQKDGFEAGADTIYERQGALSIASDGWALNVIAENGHGFRQARAHLFLPSGTLTRARDRYNDVGYFGAWSVYLENSSRAYESRIEIVKFQVKKID